MKLAELVAGIRKRPEMYLGIKSIQCLRSYLLGYMHAMSESGKNNFSKDYVKFREWIAKKFRVTTAHGWVEIIIYHYSLSEIEAFDDFFILFDEFVKGDTSPVY